MCIHCANLIEDKVVVHAFFELAAKRLTEKHRFPVSADEIEAVLNIKPTSRIATRPPISDPDGKGSRICRKFAYGYLNEIGKAGA